MLRIVAPEFVGNEHLKWMLQYSEKCELHMRLVCPCSQTVVASCCVAYLTNTMHCPPPQTLRAGHWLSRSLEAFLERSGIFTIPIVRCSGYMF